MKEIQCILLMIMVLLFYGCHQKEVKKKLPGYALLEKYDNVLDFNGSPKEAFDKNMLMFSDHGAWFAFGFPDRAEYFGGFSGLFLLTEQKGIWSSPVLAKL